MIVDTHCHIHEAEFYDDNVRQEIYERAIAADVRMICVGTSETTSREAVEFASNHTHTWATVGVHPHDTRQGISYIEQILNDNHEKVVGVGEIGLDYYYMNSPKQVQIAALEQQLQWALDHNMPVSFHVRDAFEDFWPIFNNFQNVRGVLHSFTDNMSNLERGLENGLYIGVNGISTFAKDEKQQQMYDAVPLEHMLFETDAPFLTPLPHRGKVNEPAFVRLVAEYHAKRRNISSNQITEVTSANALTLFGI